MSYGLIDNESFTIPRDDSFHLRPLQLVASGGSHNKNLLFVGRGGSGTTFKVVCEKGPFSGSNLL